LGSRFGKVTQIISALCSITGIIYFAGWEIAITQSGLESLVKFSEWNSSVVWSVAIFSFVGIALLYSVLGGQKINSILNPIFNRIKFFLFGLIVIAIIYVVYAKGELSFELLVPNFSVALLSIGIIGFITNILFNFFWQFVDNTSWQTISSSSPISSGLKKLLPRTSVGVLFAYLLGTLLGALLRFIPELNSDNILGSFATIFNSEIAWIFILSFIILLLLSMMSLVDGLGLSISQSFIVDLGIGNKVKQKIKKISRLQLARLCTIIAVIFAAFGVRLILNAFGVSIFDFVYILIVAQLSLIGTVLVGLMFPNKNISYMWVSIIGSLFVGISANILGGVLKMDWLIDAAGTITILTSIFIAVLIYFTNMPAPNKRFGVSRGVCSGTL
jgi:hypothetical protein